MVEKEAHQMLLSFPQKFPDSCVRHAKNLAKAQHTKFAPGNCISCRSAFVQNDIFYLLKYEIIKISNERMP